MLELLINKGANVDYLRKSDGSTPLSGLIATSGGRKRSIELDSSRPEQTNFNNFGFFINNFQPIQKLLNC